MALNLTFPGGTSENIKDRVNQLFIPDPNVDDVTNRNQFFRAFAQAVLERLVVEGTIQVNTSTGIGGFQITGTPPAGSGISPGAQVGGTSSS